MILSGGMPTIFVGDMDAAVRFYTEALELKLLERHANHWASIDGGHGLTRWAFIPRPRRTRQGGSDR